MGRKSRSDQHRTGHQGCDSESVIAKACNDVEHHDDEGAGGSADLMPASAQCGDQRTGDNGSEEPALGTNATRDGERHGERHCHNGDGQTGEDVGLETGEAVAFLKNGDEFGNKEGPVSEPCGVGDWRCRHAVCQPRSVGQGRIV